MAEPFEGINPLDLTLMARELAPRVTTAVDDVFPVQDTIRFEYELGKRERSNKLAVYRPFDGVPHKQTRETATTRVGILPALSESLVMGELSRLRAETAATGGDVTPLIVENIEADVVELVEAIHNREALARLQAVSGHKVTFTQDGMPGVEVDFGVPGTQRDTVAVSWSNASTAKPLSDLTELVGAATAAGATPGAIVMAVDAFNLMLATDEVDTYAANFVGAGIVPTRSDLDALFSRRGLPPIRIENSSFDLHGQSVTGWPTDIVALIPNANTKAGVHLRGTPPIALDASANGIVSREESAGIWASVWKSPQPTYQITTQVDALTLPVIRDTKEFWTLDITA